VPLASEDKLVQEASEANVDVEEVKASQGQREIPANQDPRVP
jgi:hypothetical protein